MPGYRRPVEPVNGRMSTYRAHTRRTTPSSEAGVDYYCPMGTPVVAGVEGRVFEIGGGIIPATGRFVTIDVTKVHYVNGIPGARQRDLHLLEWRVKAGQLVEPDTVIGLSGASGYGSEFFGAGSLAAIPSNTGGPHVHRTLWPTREYRFGRYPYEPTLDFELYVEEDMDASQIKALDEARNAAKAAETHSAETRRMLGVILGWSAPATENEKAALGRLMDDDATTDVEVRRLLGVLLGWNEPANDREAAALAALRAVPDLDETAIAAAIAPHLPGVDADGLASSVAEGILAAFRAQWSK